jgi:hypothetical protein
VSRLCDEGCSLVGGRCNGVITIQDAVDTRWESNACGHLGKGQALSEVELWGTCGDKQLELLWSTLYSPRACAWERGVNGVSGYAQQTIKKRMLYVAWDSISAEGTSEQKFDAG